MRASSKPTVAYIGIGSNLHEPSAQVVSAMAAIDALTETWLESRSCLYSSPPMGPPDQPDYVNAVVKIGTRLNALQLLDALQRLECTHGRVRNGIRWGPRTLDLDILLFGDEIIDGERLQVPHPGLMERAFVIIPLAEIAPTLILPNGTPVNELAQSMSASAVTRLPDD